MAQRARRRAAAAVVLVASLAVLPRSGAAVSLAGRWLVEADGTTQVSQVAQTGDTVTIPVSLAQIGSGQLTGPITAAGEFDLTPVGYSCSSPLGFRGRLLPDESAMDGLFVAASCLNPTWEFVVLTRCSCYDGNSAGGDGCDATCQVEPCFTCSGDPSVCTPTVDGGSCDDRRDCTTGETCTAGACGGGSAIVPCVDMTGLWHVRSEVVPFSVVTEGTAEITQRNGVVRPGGIPTIGGFRYMGPIDLATGDFDLASPELKFILGCPFLDPLVGSAGPDTFAAMGVFQTENIRCESFEVAVTGTRLPCGNGTIEAGQECDDGDSDPGDGCDQFCRVEACHTCAGEPSVCVPQADSTVCSDGDGCTTGDSCLAGSCQGTPLSCGTCESCNPTSGTCVGAPRPVCRASTAVQKSLLKLRNTTPDSADLVNWKWMRGADTALADLGDPPGATDYTLCVFDESSVPPALLFRAQAPAGGNWQPKGSSGFGYKEQTGAPEGVTGITLKAGAAGKARAVVKGKGALLSSRPAGLPPLPLPLPLRVQLQSSTGTCFEARYGTAGLLENDPATGRFRGRAMP